MTFLALDIGGANLKAADGDGYAASMRFALWREPGQLATNLRRMIAEAPASTRLAVTMTAELADCFADKSEGVLEILDAVDEAADGRPVRVYRNDGRLVAPAVIRSQPFGAAATNWHALARYAARWRDESGVTMLIDVGSSTCDLIRLADPEEIPAAATDTERLLAGQLVYLGVERTPVCSLVSELPYRGRLCPIARELFATTLDVSLLLGRMPEALPNTDTADGRPATKAAARKRMSRMICAGLDEFNHRDAVAMAHAVEDAQARLLALAIEKTATGLTAPPMRIVISGHGDWLARAALARLGWQQVRLTLLSAELGSAVSRCAPAHALAVLARESMQA